MKMDKKGVKPVTFLGIPKIDHLEPALDAAALRHKVIANNVANVDTPFFKRSEVRFEELLRQEMNTRSGIVGKRTDPRHFKIGRGPQNVPTPEVVESKTVAMNNNQNNVDIDYEMTHLAYNQLRYNVLIQETSNEFRRVRIALDGRR